ncbi:MAG: Crp/Fnr family transcriptional regulator [Bacteroidia bacterium]
MYNELKYWYLRDHRLFGVLSNEQLKQLCVITNYKKAKKGEIIYLGESEKPRIYFLKKGNIKITEIDEEGNEMIREILQKGDIFGELSLSSVSTGNEVAQVLSADVAICSFLVEDFEKVMQKYPELAVSYIKMVGFKFKRLTNSYTNLVQKDARTRLVHFLKDWAKREGTFDGEKVTLQNYLTQYDIARIICTSRQTATQLLNDLETLGILQYNRKEIMIPNLSLLK